MIAFLFAINVLFDGLAKPWFIYPSIPLALLIYLHYRRGQKPLRTDGHRRERAARRR